MLRHLILTAVLIILAAPVFATEADFEKRMARGVTALDAGNAQLAQEEFRDALKEHPDDREAALYLAIALNRANDPAAESALKSALRLDPDNPRINLELGTYYFNHAMYDEAGDYFENILTRKPDQEMRSAAEQYLAAIRSHGGARRWGATGMLGIQYDSNVPLAASGAQLPAGIERKDDIRTLFNLGLNGIGYRDSEQELTGSYSLYQTMHLKLSDFNLTQNQLEVSYKRQLTPVYSAKVSGGADMLLLGGKQYLTDFSITPGVFATFREGTLSGIEYRLRDSFFKDSDTFPTNSDRNGLSHSLVISHRQPLNDSVTLRGYYTIDREGAVVKAWSATSHRFLAGAAISLSEELLLDVSFDSAGKWYDEAQAGATERRSDTTITGAASLTWQFMERVGASVGCHYTSNASNISGYGYSRNIISVMIMGRY